MKNTKILSEKIIFQSKYFEVKQITLERNGKTFVKEFSQRLPVVLVLALTENDELYLVSQYREILQKQSLEVIAGTCEGNSSPLETAKRELEEEAGLTAKHWEQLTTFDLSANVLQKIHLFVAKDLTLGNAHPDDDEDIHAIKVPFNEAVKKALTGEITITASIAAILLFDKVRE